MEWIFASRCNGHKLSGKIRTTTTTAMVLREKRRQVKLIHQKTEEEEEKKRKRMDRWNHGNQSPYKCDERTISSKRVKRT